MRPSTLRPLSDVASLHLLPDGLSLALVLGSLGALAQFFRIDQRPPMDLGHYFEALPGAWRALGAFDVVALADIAVGSGGLYNLFLAALTHAFGRSPLLLEAVEPGWLGLLLLSAWAAARRLGGPWAGLAGTALCAAMPVFQVGARSHWIHLPEAALLALALALWLRDPALERRGSGLGLLVALGAAFTLRPTALVFGVPLLVAAAPRARGRLWLPALSLLPAAVVLLPWLPDYVGGKAMIRTVYAQTVQPLGAALLEQTFLLPALATTAGLALLLWLARPALRHPAAWLLGLWLATGLGLCAFFHAGPDNFHLLFLAAALLASLGLALPGSAPWMSRLRPAVGALLCAVAALALAVPMLRAPLAGPVAPLLGPGVLSVEPRHYLRPQVEVPSLDQFWPLFDQACVHADETCTVIASRGLVNYNREDDLSLAHFLLGRDGLRIRNAGQYFFIDDMESTDAVEGLAVLDCPHGAAEPDNLFTERERALEAMVTGLNTTHVGVIGAPMRCVFRIWRLDVPDPHQAVRDFWQAYPWRHSGPGACPEPECNERVHTRP